MLTEVKVPPGGTRVSPGVAAQQAIVPSVNLGSLSRLPRGVLERESMPRLNGRITTMEDAFAVSRMQGIRLSGSMWRGPETE
jgi:hypothetical protein